jgi:hypothetical protein
MRPLWRNAAGSLARIVTVPPASELWYDDRDIPALREDEKDAADIQQSQAITIRELINAGYEPDRWSRRSPPGITTSLRTPASCRSSFRNRALSSPQSLNGNGQPQLPAPAP